MRDLKIERTKHDIEKCLIDKGFSVNVYDRLSKEIVKGLTVMASFKGDCLSLTVCADKGNSTRRWSLDVDCRELSLIGMSMESLVDRAISEAVNRELFNN